MRTRAGKLLGAAWLLGLMGAICAVPARADERRAATVQRWEAEEYRAGGEGVAYHDSTPGNSGPGRVGDVDLGLCLDGVDCVSVDEWARGEWISFDTPPLDAGTYLVKLRLAVPERLASLRVSFGGESLEGFLRVPQLAWSTGGNERWADVWTRPIRLPAGSLVLYVVQAGTMPLRVNWLELLRTDGPPAAPTAVPTVVPPQPTEPVPQPSTAPPATPTEAPTVGTVPRFAWFSKPPADGTPATALARRVDTIVLTHHDEAYRDQLLALGVPPDRILQYVLANEIQDPGGCDRAPWGNNAAWHIGDFCRIREAHPDWFLRDPDGRPLLSSWGGYRWYMMDPGNAGWQSFMVERLREAADRFGWQDIFLDNLDGGIGRGDSPRANYGSDESYQAAIESFVRRIRAEHIDPRGLALYANLTERPDDDVWHRYLRLLDGGMEETCILDWSNADGVRYRSPERWERQIQLLETTQAAGKTIVCVAQGVQSDERARRFAYASYLLAASGGALFRFADSGRYDELWDHPSYELRLGRPLGARYRHAAGWRRDFEHYSVLVDPQTHEASLMQR